MSVRADRKPNLFELRGGNTQITYSTSSISGRPLLRYKDARHNRNFSGSDIRVQQTEIGRQVTVTVEAVPDLRTVMVTLLLPGINLTDDNSAPDFQTSAIITTQRTTIAGPRNVRGAVQTYRVVSLSGQTGSFLAEGTRHWRGGFLRERRDSTFGVSAIAAPASARILPAMRHAHP